MATRDTRSNVGVVCESNAAVSALTTSLWSSKDEEEEEGGEENAAAAEEEEKEEEDRAGVVVVVQPAVGVMAEAAAAVADREAER